MKNKMMAVVSIFILLILAVVIGGFLVFTKRLAESKKNKEMGEISTERTIPSEGAGTKKNQSAVETGLKLQITSPSDKSVVTSPYITLRGKTVAQAEVFVNDKELVADQDGNFSVSLTLDEGDNPIIVVANDQNGNVGETEITVSYETSE